MAGSAPETKRSRSTRRSAPVQVVPAAVASELSIRTLCLANRSRAANYLAEFGTTQTGGAREEQSIIAVTLDWLLESLAPPSVLKIDVEGAEMEVLAGANRLFETVRPSSSARSFLPVNALSLDSSNLTITRSSMAKPPPVSDNHWRRPPGAPSRSPRE